jgi:hypothetical protein
VVFKELDPLDWPSGAGPARRGAEEQVPYYLRRHFGDSTQVDVLNQVCVTTGGLVTSIDHLVLHAYGMVVIDSRSVSGHLQVEEDGRWACLEGSRMRVIRSPVTRAYQQALSLKAFLDKKVRQKGFFDRIAGTDFAVAVDVCGQLVNHGFRHIRNERHAAGHVAVDRAIADGEFALVAGRNDHAVEFVGERHECHAAQAGLQVFFGQVRLFSFEDIAELVIHGGEGFPDGDFVAFDAEVAGQGDRIVDAALRGKGTGHGDAEDVLFTEGGHGESGRRMPRPHVGSVVGSDGFAD